MLTIIAILFLNPPLKHAVSKAQQGIIAINPEPYQGGYLDFMKYSNLADACSTPGPNRELIIEDTSYYWSTYGHRINVGPNPIIATFLP